MSGPSPHHIYGGVAVGENAAKDLRRGIQECFISANVLDSNGESANIVDALASIAEALNRIADAMGEK